MGIDVDSTLGPHWSSVVDVGKIIFHPYIFEDLLSSPPRCRINMHESYAYIYVNMHIANCHMVLGVNILAIL